MCPARLMIVPRVEIDERGAEGLWFESTGARPTPPPRIGAISANGFCAPNVSLKPFAFGPVRAPDLWTRTGHGTSKSRFYRQLCQEFSDVVAVFKVSDALLRAAAARAVGIFV